MTTFSCVLIGSDSLLVTCAEQLLDAGHRIALIVTADASVAAWAEGRELPVAAAPHEIAGRVPAGSVDWMLSIANLSVIPPEALAVPRLGTVNFHDGPLPRYAGLNAPAWALLAGETRWGITWHMVEGGIDEGDILVQRLFEIAPDDTAFSLNGKCFGAAAESFPKLIAALATGAPERQAQDLTQRSYCARDDRPAGAGWLDPSRPAEALIRQVRALDFGGYWNPLGLPKLATDAGTLFVGRAEPAEGAAAAPGTVLESGGGALVVATGTTPLRLSDLSGPGARDLPGSGAQLGRPDAAAIDAEIARTAPAEHAWRTALRAAQPAPTPFAAAPAGAPEWQRLDLPADLPEGSDLLAALALWAARSTGVPDAALAISSQALRDAARTGATAPWVPLSLEGARDAGGARKAAARLHRRLDARGGFAVDLPARDPAIALDRMPEIVLSDKDAPVEGSVLTLCPTAAPPSIHVDAARMAPEAARLLCARIAPWARALAAAPEDAPLDGLGEVPEAERQLFAGWNDTAADVEGDLTVHRAFERQAARRPGAEAVVCEDVSLSYGALNARANSIARALREMGVRPGAHVGLCLRRSVDMVAAALGILKAGGAYVPIDPAYPPDRIAHYVADSEASVIVTHSAMLTLLPEGGAQRLLLDSDARLDGPPPARDVDGGARAEDLAYLIYTSGSTGLPKGVMVEHRNVINFFAGMDQCIAHREGDVWLAVTSLSFDISVLELFWTLARGFKVVLSGEENRAAVSKGPMALSDRRIDFNLFYWGNDDGAGRGKYELLLEGAKFADAHGFNAVWTPERHFHAFGGPYPNPSVTGAAVAAVTRNLAVRAGSCVAPLHHPVRIAEEWAVIDNLTNGRAGLAIASGWQPDDFVLRPENTPPANKPAMYRAIEDLRRLWRGEPVEFPRQDGTPFAVLSQPRPVSAELPVWVTTAGNPDTWREAGEIGANVLTHLLGQSIEEVADKIVIYYDALRAAGRDPADHTVSLMLHTYLGADRDGVRETARGPMKDYLRSAAGLIKQYAWAFPAFKRPKGVDNPFQMDLRDLSGDEMEAILDFAFERYFEDAGLFGTVTDALERVEQLKRIGVDEIACLIDYGIPKAKVMEGLVPLAEALDRANRPARLDPDDFSLAAQVVRHGVTHLQCTPSMARLIAMNDEARAVLGRLQHLMVGGEALPGELVAELRRCTRARITNMYGPTETTIWSGTQPVADAPAGTVPVGRPIANTQFHVLDEDGRAVPIGVPGELCIGGAGVTRGYWRREALTEERFPPDPVAGGGRMYRTGDLVRWRADGSLDFLGRTDHQVKIRGQRIELGEIEAAMAAVPGVGQAVVAARRIGADERLVGYYTGPGADEAALRSHLEARLTEAMVPAHFVRLDRFPLTPNKKIDRKALPDPAPRAIAAPRINAPGAAPAGGTEAAIAAIWSRILGVEGIRGTDNFFALGGHSLLAVQAHREIRSELGVQSLSITDIFRFPVLSALAAHLGGGAPDPDPAPDDPAPERAETMSRRRAMRAARTR